MNNGRARCPSPPPARPPPPSSLLKSLTNLRAPMLMADQDNAVEQNVLVPALKNPLGVV